MKCPEPDSAFHAPWLSATGSCPASLRDDAIMPSSFRLCQFIVLVLSPQDGTRTRKTLAMTDIVFDHDKLDVYRLSIEYVATSFAIAKETRGAPPSCP